MEIAHREVLHRRREGRAASKAEHRRGRLIFFAADKWEIACEVLGRFRLRIAEMQKLTAGSEPKLGLNFLWVIDFPLLEFSPEENKWNAVHHPFTRPKAEDMPLLEARKFGEVRAEAYDVVLNGVEIGGGTIRIHEPELQAKMFAVLGVSAEDQQAKFGHLLRAFQLGAPPHGGIALGLDRLVMLICGEESIRDVMAFPKNNRGIDLMSQSPAEVDPRQLRDLGIKLARETCGRPEYIENHRVAFNPKVKADRTTPSDVIEAGYVARSALANCGSITIS